MRIANRLVLLLGFSVVAVISLSALVSQRQREIMLQDALIQETETLAWTLQVVVNNALRDRRFADLHLVLGEVVEDPETFVGAVFDPWGRVVAGGADRDLACLQGTVPEVRSVRTARRGWVDCDGPVRWIALPLNGAEGTLLVARRATLMERDIRTSRIRHLLLALALATTMALVIHLVLRRVLSLPLLEVMRGVHDLQEAGPPTTIRVSRSAGEIGDLAHAFNAMAEELESRRKSLLREADERLALERRLKEAEKFAMLGRLSGGLAHELGSPLGVIELRAERILALSTSSPDVRRQAEEVLGEVDRITRLVHALLHAGRQHGVARHPVDLGEVIRAVVDEIEPSADAAGVRIEVRAPTAPLSVGGDATLLRHALFNLAINAVQALSTHPGRRIVRIELRQDDGPARVVVEDTGPGIAREHLGHLFEPFFTTKPLGEGTGLGLAISRGIVEEHGGELRVELPEEGGVRVVMALPAGNTSGTTRKAA